MFLFLRFTRGIISEKKAWRILHQFLPWFFQELLLFRSSYRNPSWLSFSWFYLGCSSQKGIAFFFWNSFKAFFRNYYRIFFPRVDSEISPTATLKILTTFSKSSWSDSRIFFPKKILKEFSSKFSSVIRAQGIRHQSSENDM